MYKKKWKISIIELTNTKGIKYKVTRRFPEMYIAETKLFRSKFLAKKQFERWMEETQ